jgi:hypothetical protein
VTGPGGEGPGGEGPGGEGPGGEGISPIEQLIAGIAPRGTGTFVDVESGDLALIDYLYDIGGESIFAPTITAAKGGKIDYDLINEIERIIGRR